MLHQGYEIIKQDTFYNFNAKTLIKLFSDDDFCAEEIDIFESIVQWLNNNPHCDEKQCKELVSTIRLSLIFWDDVIAHVWPSGTII